MQGVEASGHVVGSQGALRHVASMDAVLMVCRLGLVTRPAYGPQLLRSWAALL